MNDHELDRLVAAAAPVRDSWIAGLDLRDAEVELMEEIMSTTTATENGGALLRGSSVPPRRRFRLAVALVAAAALVVAVVAVRALTPGDDTGVSNTNVPDVLPLMMDPTPEGLAVTMIAPEKGMPHVYESREEVNTWVYGVPSATSIGNDVVLRASVPDRAHAGEPLGNPVTVRGKPGIACEPGPKQCDFGDNVTGVSWTESGLDVSVESRTFDAAQVLVIAEGLTFEGRTPRLGGMPAGVATPGEVASLSDDWAREASVDYSGKEAGALVQLSTRHESDDMRIYDLWLAGPRVDATVQGHGASVEDIDGQFVIVWEVVPGQLAEAMISGVDRATALAWAETVRPASAAEWKDLQRHVVVPVNRIDPYGPEPDHSPEHPLRVKIGGSELWAFVDGGDLCYFQGEHGKDRSTLCTGETTRALGVSPSYPPDPGDLMAGVGVAPEGTKTITGDVDVKVTFGKATSQGRLFVFESKTGKMPSSLRFLDRSGGELATTEVVVF